MIKNIFGLVTVILLSFFQYSYGENLISNYQAGQYSEFIKKFHAQYQTLAAAKPLDQYLYAESLSKLNKYQQANRVYGHIVKHHFQKDLSKLKSRQNKDLSPNFVLILSKIARNHLNSYRAHPTPESQQAQSYKKAYLHYDTILQKIDRVSQDKLYSMQEDYQDFIQQIESRHFNWNYFLEVGYMSFKTSPILVSKLNGVQTPLMANASGFWLGGGVRYENNRRAYLASLKYSAGSASVAALSSSVSYSQKSAGVALISLELGHLFKLAAGAAEIGASLSLTSSSGDYPPPKDYAINNKGIISVGYNLLSYYNFTPHWALSFQIGDVLNFESSVWQFGVRYRF